jgi:hypothetical protein
MSVRALVDYSAEGAPWRKRQALYVVFTVVVAAIMAAAVVEVLTGVPIYGVTTDEVTQQGAGTEVTVHYPRVTRGQLDSTLTLDVEQDGGFDAPVAVRVTSAYFDMFDVQAIHPQPASETLDDTTWTLTFDPPDGDTLQVQWDMVARPVGWFSNEVGSVVVDAQGGPTPALQFTSAVRP